MMKNLILLVAAVFTLGFAACSDDDESIAEQISGTYTGTIAVNQEDGTPMNDPLEDQKIYIVKSGDNVIDLELKDFKFGIISVGDLKVPNVRVEENGSISGEALQVSIIDGTIKADLKLNGSMKDNKADLTIKVTAPLTAGEQPIVMMVTFKGSK